MAWIMDRYGPEDFAPDNWQKQGHSQRRRMGAPSSHLLGADWADEHGYVPCPNCGSYLSREEHSKQRDGKCPICRPDERRNSIYAEYDDYHGFFNDHY